MNNLKIKSRIIFNASSKRDSPILDGYKPLFDYFHKRFKVSEKIFFIDNFKELSKGQNTLVIIYIPQYNENEINAHVGINSVFVRARI